jgi:hypothetical protein
MKRLITQGKYSRLKILVAYVQWKRITDLTYLTTHGAEPFLRSRQLCRLSTQHFMEPKDSMPCSQEPSSSPYPEPYQSSPHHPILSL